jgi:hypothetical protein
VRPGSAGLSLGCASARRAPRADARRALRKREALAAGEPDTPDAPTPQVHAQTQSKRAKTMPAECFCTLMGKTYDEFI